MINKIYKFMKDNEGKQRNVPFHEQSIINAVCYHKIEILLAKIGIFNFNCIQ